MGFDLAQIMAEVTQAASAIRAEADKVAEISKQFRDHELMLHVDLQAIEARLYSISKDLAKLNDDGRTETTDR